MEAEKQKAAWLANFSVSLSELVLADKKANLALTSLAEYQVLSHRDMDLKNVLWHEDKPMLIDWEAAGFINPLIELVEYAYCWVGGADNHFDKKRYLAFMNAYFSVGEKIDAMDLNEALMANYKGKLNWLAFNLTRALALNNDEANEIMIGNSEVMKTMAEIKGYSSLLTTMLELIKQCLQ